MRRVLPRTLLRPLLPAVRPQATIPIAVSRRFASSKSDDPNSIPLLSLAGPSTIHPSNASLVRTTPQKVARRRTLHPPHPKLSASPLADPELYDLSSQRRMPIKMEIDFDAYRRRGLFPGEEAVARTHFLEAIAKWRNRIRGNVSKYWHAEERRWIEGSKLKFMIDEAIARGVNKEDLPHSQELDIQNLVLSGKVVLNEDEINAQSAETIYPGKSAAEIIGLSYHEGNLNPEVVNWDQVQERLDAESQETPLDRSAWKQELVAYRIYLPNTVIRLVRNYTPADEPYDPWVATFRIPPSMTKLDLRSYLKSVYGLDVTFIRTDVYWGKVARNRQNGRIERLKGRQNNYKRAVVGLTQPFHYPDDELEYRALGRQMGMGDKLYDTRLQTLEDTYFMRQTDQSRRHIIREFYKRAIRFRKNPGNAGATIKSIMARRIAREEAIKQAAVKFRSDVSAQKLGLDPAEIRQAVEEGMRQ